MPDHEVVQRLDTIISILKLAHSEALAQVRKSTLGDEVSASILDSTAEGFVAAGDLKRDVAKSTKQSEKTVQRRIADLVAMGVLEKRPDGRAAYRSTGIL
jgi:hypothetical protein